MTDRLEVIWEAVKAFFKIFMIIMFLNLDLNVDEEGADVEGSQDYKI